MTFLLTFEEIVNELQRTPAAARMWLSRHGIKASRRIAVGERATRGVYDGELVVRHARALVDDCAACRSAVLR